MIRPIYLDYNGTTPHDPRVIEAMRPFLETEFGNPSSSQWYGIGPKRAVEKARSQMAGLLGCAPREILFTSGGTESNNHAIRGLVRTAGRDRRHIVTSAVEHPAVLEVCRALEKFCHGAGQEAGRRAGTENVLEIVGLGAACEIAAAGLAQHDEQMHRLCSRLHERIAGRLSEIRLNGHSDLRLPNTLSLSFRGLKANRILEEIGLEVAASAGAACHSDTIEISHVLAAMAVPEDWAMGTLRFSLGRMTTEAEIDRAADVVCDAVNKLRKAS